MSRRGIVRDEIGRDGRQRQVALKTPTFAVLGRPDCNQCRRGDPEMRRREHVGRVNVRRDTETSVGSRDDDRPRTHARRRGRIARVHGRRRERTDIRRREHIERGVDDTV